jgi:EAL domain-containing protein (putative c-di-GMP-specific phosphodiesterase class I)
MMLLDDIVRSDALRSVFQPIVRLGAEPGVFGYESLARFRTDSPLRDPEVLFKYASRKHRVVELELACIANSLHDGAALAKNGLLFLNIHPDVFAPGASFRDTIVSQAERAGVALDRLVLEITEQASLAHTPVVLKTISDAILEGIEDESTATTAAYLGIRLGQGYFFARPADPSTFV